MRHYFTGDGDLSISCASDIDSEIRAVEATAHAKYRPVRVRPWVLTSLGRPGEGLCGDLRRLARMRLQLSDVSAAVSHPSVLQYLLHRWRAELSCALVMGDMGVYMDAVQGGPPRGGGPPAPADVQVYDLQSMRLY